MKQLPLHVLLADDDTDDCLIFRDALEELPIKTSLKTVNDGEKLMDLLAKDDVVLPDIVFLDMNMPRKTGYECLSEIKHNKQLQHLPVVIFSTSLSNDMINLLYAEGAHFYIRKPGLFSQIKEVILHVLTVISEKESQKRSKEEFVIEAI